MVDRSLPAAQLDCRLLYRDEGDPEQRKGKINKSTDGQVDQRRPTDQTKRIEQQTNIYTNRLTDQHAKRPDYYPLNRNIDEP